MRYQRLQDIVRLAVRFQGALGGLTLGDIEDEFGVSRRTAERLRDAVDAVFGPLELVDTADTKRHWRLRSDALRRLVSLSAEELAELVAAAETLARAGFNERAAALRELDAKLRATLRTDTLARIESDLQVLVHVEGLAMRAGPRPHLDPGLLALLREGITTRRVVEFRYLAQSTRRRSRQRVAPYGLLYGNRAFLVGKTDWSDEPRLWRLANMGEARITGVTFEPYSGFDLRTLRRALLRHLPGETRPGRPSFRPRRGTGCLRLPLPPDPVHQREPRRLGDGTLQGGRYRRDVLAPLHLGRQRHRREARPPPTALGGDMRRARGASRPLRTGASGNSLSEAGC